MDSETTYQSDLPALVRRLEANYISSTTLISKHVTFQLLDTLNQIDAYINSKHISGPTDSQGREKPFFNIVVAARNIWYRATDLDRKNIRVKATKNTDVIDAFLATVFLQDWMRRYNFGAFLNEWGRTLATYGSAVVKFIENDDGLQCNVVPWNRLIVDSIDFDKNWKIEILELTKAELTQKKGYNKEMVEKLLSAMRPRETVDRRRKDNRNFYIKLYEVHGMMPLSYLTQKESDKDIYTQQMHVLTFLANRENPEGYDIFTLYSGREKQDPYMITHLIKEDGRVLGIGSVEHLFESQWMVNHTVKSIKDQLDLASKLIFQTSDGSFVGQNALNAIENGDILIHAPNQPLETIGNTSHDISSLQNFQTEWRDLANELNGISEAMLGQTPPSGTPWRQVKQVLAESYSLFSLMTENKGLAVEDMLRKFIIPYIKNKELNHADQIALTLKDYDITQIDEAFIKNSATKYVNEQITNSYMSGKSVSPSEQKDLMDKTQGSFKDALNTLGNQRFFKPSDIDEKTWKEQFKDIEWELEADIVGEDSPDKEDLDTLTTVLQTIGQNPAVLTDPNGKMVFNKILNIAGAVSPLELSKVQSQPTPPPQPAQPIPSNIVPAQPVGGQ